MKNNLFRKFTALLLSGTMLAGVGCKDYDDDIDNINKRLDDMEVTISSLPEQLEAIKASIPDISSLTSRVAELEGKLEGVTDLKEQLDALKGLESTLKQYVDNKIGEATSGEALKEVLGNYYATADALSALEEKLPKSGDTVDQAIQEAVNEIQGDITDLKNNVGNWMGPEMKEYLEANGYATKTYVDDAKDAVKSDILDQIKAEQSDYKTAIENIVNESLIGQDGKGKVGKSMLDDELKQLIEKIEPLMNRVIELEGRIQSLVYVPSTLEEAQTNTIMFEGTSYIEFDGDKKYYLGPQNSQSALITFRISPASLVEKLITDENISIVTEKVTRSAASDPSFDVEVVSTDAETGKFVVRASTDYKYGEVETETLAIALNVKVAADEENGSTYGIDYTTDFIGTDYENGGSINDKLVIAMAPAEEGGAFVEATGSYNTELKYSDSETTVEFMKGFDVYYKDGDQYFALDKMWNNAPEINIAEPEEAATASANESSYELTATTAKIATPSTDLIGNTITSGNFTYSVSVGDNTLEVGTVNHVVTIASENTNSAAISDVKLHWQYDIAKAGADNRNEYAGAPVRLEEKLSAETYKEIAAFTKNSDLTLDANEYEVTLYENGTAVEGITADIVLTSTPTVDTDAQFIEVTLNGDLKKTANYVAKAVYKKADQTTVTISANIAVTGMPVLAENGIYTMGQAEKIFVGVYEFPLMQNFAEFLWNESLTEAFGSKENFLAAIYAATATSTKEGKAELSVSNTNNINVTFDTDAEYETNYMPSIKFTDSKGTGLEVTFVGNVKLMPFQAEMSRNDIFFYEPGKALAMTDLTDNVFKVIEKTLEGAYYYNGDNSDATSIIYSIAESEEDLEGLTTAPSISNNVLSWGDWNKRELKVKAELMIEDRVLDTENFVVTINDPVDAEIKANSGVDATIYAGSTTKTFEVASMLKLAAQKGSAIDASTNVFGTGEDAANGLNKNLAEALDGSVTFTLAEGTNTLISLEDGIVTFNGDSALEFNEFEVTVHVVYSYQFGERNYDAKIKVKPGTK